MEGVHAHGKLKLGDLLGLSNPNHSTILWLSEVIFQSCIADWLVTRRLKSCTICHQVETQKGVLLFFPQLALSSPFYFQAYILLSCSADIWLWSSNWAFRDPLSRNRRMCCFELNYWNVYFSSMSSACNKKQTYWGEHLVSWLLLSVSWLCGLSCSAEMEYISISILMEVNW